MQKSFPVDAALPELSEILSAGGRAILTASPGSGKTTRVPLALLGLLPMQESRPPAFVPLPGTILVLEPRRLAARAAARYMAGMLGQEVGQLVGYRVRLESKVSPQTRIELLTEGMFTRRLLADPELTGVSCVIFDEFHERGLQADLGLALCRECVEALRPDLRLLFMSATLEAEELSRYWGDCPILTAKGRNWPVNVRHAGRELCIAPGAGVEEIAAKTALAVRESLNREPGSILAFLPGQAEIRRCAALLERRPEDTDVHPLYGDLPPAAQDAAIAPALPGRRKVVLATDLAQTSLTIEGVRLVIDAGLVRGPRFEPATGLSRLATTRLTRDAADQRAGRAGRLEPGFCLRLWPEQEPLLPRARPEIMDADLAPVYLDALAWGSDPQSLPWLTPPPQAALRNAAATLLALEAARPGSYNLSGSPVSLGGSAENTPGNATYNEPGNAPGNTREHDPPVAALVITPHGRRLARLPLHPRLAHMVLGAAKLTPDRSALAACLAALVSERDPLRGHAAGEAGADIRLRLPLLRLPEHRRLREAAGQIYRLSGLADAPDNKDSKDNGKSGTRRTRQSVFALPGPQEEDDSGALLSLAWPERIARRRETGGFRLASGQGAELPAHDPLAGEPWLAVAGLGGGLNRRIHLAAPLPVADLLRLHGNKIRTEEDVRWDSRAEAVVCRRLQTLGALLLEEKPLPPSPELRERMLRALLEGIAALGPDCLPWTAELRQWQARVLLLRGLERIRPDAGPGVEPDARSDTGPDTKPDTKPDAGPDTEPDTGPNIWPDVSDAALLAGLTGPPETVWLAPWLDGVTRRAQLAALDLGAALRALLPWPLPQRLDEEAPERIALPSGSSARVDYLPVLRGEPPVLAVKLQEMFGQTDTPRLAQGRLALMLHLLSPAGRPLQVTGDLRHFWANAYKQVRAEMRGRYPRHPWPEDPLSALPTGKTKKRLEAAATIRGK